MASNPSLSKRQLAFLDIIIDATRESGVNSAEPLDFIHDIIDVLDGITEVLTTVDAAAEDSSERRAVKEAVKKMQAIAHDVPMKLSLDQLIALRRRAGG